MNTSFKPSEFDKQAAASLDMIDEQAAAERVQRILHPEPKGARSQAQAGPTLTPAPQTQPQAPAEALRRGISKEDMKKYVEEGIPVPAPRKKRSDAGIPKKPPADPDEIVLRLTLAEARNAAIACGKFDCYGISEHIQDQIIAQLQKRLDALQKQE